jgi:KDO2-lipid IV(A) lauroyltransferase
LKGQVGRLLAGAAEASMIGLVRAVFALARALGPERSSDFGGFLARTFGPLLGAHRTAMRNLRAAFPERSEAEVQAIARGAWDNLGRTGAEYAHLARLFDYDPSRSEPGRIEVEGIDRFLALRDDGRPGLIFSAHLGNWELPAICAARFGLPATAVFRTPNDRAVARVVHEARRETMGGLEAARPGAAFAMRGVLERGGHLGMLIDQHFTRGVLVEFFGRPALANPILAKFARQFDCPVHGVRVVRLPGPRFRLELTPALDLPRDPDGQVDVQGAMQAMTRVVEGWVREEPEQWLWMHRRWRAPPAAAGACHHEILIGGVEGRGNAGLASPPAAAPPVINPT